jgi:hypothetical protein
VSAWTSYWNALNPEKKVTVTEEAEAFSRELPGKTVFHKVRCLLTRASMASLSSSERGECAALTLRGVWRVACGLRACAGRAQNNFDGFLNTELDAYLKDKGKTLVVCCGLISSCCVLFTASGT